VTTAAPPGQCEPRPLARAERHLWAVDVLAVDAGDRVLEFGRGAGITAGLICDKLDRGRLVAIDRSAAMIRLAANRNRAHVLAGRATFHAADLRKADLGNPRFDKILAINVSLFWKQPTAELAIVRKWLARGGRLYVFHQPPAGGEAREIADQTATILGANGFHVEKVLSVGLRPAPMTCVIARGRGAARLELR